MTEHEPPVADLSPPPEAGPAAEPPFAALDGGAWTPPRFRRGRRVLCAGLAWIAFIGGVRLAWGAYADWRVARLLDSWRAAGAPTHVAQLQSAPEPEGIRAADLLRRAAALAGGRSTAGLSPRAAAQADPAELAADYEQDRPLLELVRAARAAPRVDWAVPLVTPLANTVATDLVDQRLVFFATDRAAAYLTLRGRCGEAIETMRDQLALVRALRNMLPLLAPLLTSSGREVWICERIEQLARRLVIQNPDLPPDPGAASAAQVRALIAELLDEAELRAKWIENLRGERLGTLEMAQLDALSAARRAVPGNAGQVRLLRQCVIEWSLAPARALSGLAEISETEPLLAAIETGAWFTPPSVAGRSRSGEALRLPGGQSAGDLARSYYRVLVNRRLSAIGLALRLHHELHGTWPAALDELAPLLGGTVPTDPCSPAGAPFGYVQEPARVYVYSIWLDGRDDHGATVVRNARRLWISPDLGFAVAGELPVVAE